ncbi:hypothetical protein LXL04_021720 [Taraxacum kok-saghyz]
MEVPKDQMSILLDCGLYNSAQMLVNPLSSAIATIQSESDISLSGIRCYSSAEPPAHIVIGMPALSPTMTQGNIAKWWKKEGDKIEVGDIICEMETDKATLEFESLEEGFLAKILVPAGAKDVHVGQPIAITVEEAENLHNIPDSVLGGSEVKEAESTQANVKTEDTVTESTSGKDQGNFARWLKKEGDKIEVGDIICEIETDKATLEFECLEEGYLAKIIAPEGSKNVLVGQPIAITVEDQADVEKVKSSSFSGDKAAKEAPPPHHATRDDVDLCMQLILDRALGLPLERPKSVTMEWLENKCKK